jgi:hypothetical protein
MSLDSTLHFENEITDPVNEIAIRAEFERIITSSVNNREVYFSTKRKQYKITNINNFKSKQF